MIELIDDLFSSSEKTESGDGVDEFAVIRLSEPREVVERIDGDDPPPDPDLFTFQRDLENGVYALREIVNGQFRDQLWKVTIEEDESSESTDDDRIEQLIQEERRTRELLRDVAEGTGERSMKKQVLRGVLGGDIDAQTAEVLAHLNSQWENGGSRQSLADLVDDPTDLREVGGAGVLKMLDNYDSLDELVEDVTAGGVRGLAQESEQPRPSDDRQAAGNLDDGDDEGEFEPRDVSGGPPSLDGLGADVEDEREIFVEEIDGGDAHPDETGDDGDVGEDLDEVDAEDDADDTDLDETADNESDDAASTEEPTTSTESTNDAEAIAEEL